MRKVRKYLSLILITIVFYIACGISSFVTQFRVVIAAGAPILNIWVQQGKISDSFRVKLIGDLNEEAGYVGQLGGCFDAVLPDTPKPAARAAKLRCVQDFEARTRPVLERNFKTNDTVKIIADDIEAVIQAAIIYYGGGVSGMDAPSAPMTEKEINRRIEKLRRDLGQ